MGAEGDWITRRDALQISTACLGTLVGTGAASATSLPPLESSYFVLTADGNLRFALVYESEPDLSGVTGDELVSVVGDSGQIELTGADRIGWGESMVTDDGVSTASDRYEFADSTERTLSEGKDTTFNTSADDAKQVPELVERPDTVVTGRINDVVSVPDFGGQRDTIENIELPEVTYVGGRTSDIVAFQKKKHVQLPDGFTYHLPVTDGISGAIGAFSTVASRFPRPPVLDTSRRVLVPPLSHRTNFALTGLRSLAGARGRPYLAIASWAEQNSIESYNQSVWDWAEQNVIKTLQFLGGPPNKFVSPNGFLFVATIAVPIGAPILTAAARSAQGVARSLRLVDQFSEAADGIADSKDIAEFYEGLAFDENDPVSAVQADRLSEAFREEGSGIPARDVSAVCTFTSTDAVQALAAADDSELPAVVAHTRRLLDRQAEEIDRHRTVVDDVVDVVSDSQIFKTARQTRAMLDEMLSSIESERRLLEQFQRDTVWSALGLTVDVEPTTPGTGTETTFTVRTDDGGTLSASGRSVDRTEWRILRTDSSADIDGLGGRATDGSGDGQVLASFDGSVEATYSFDDPGRFLIEAEVYLRNQETPLRASTELEVVREVTANIDVQQAIPTDRDVELNGRSSIARTDTSITTYDWTIATERAYQDATRTFRRNDNPDPTLARLRETLPDADTASGPVAEYPFDEGEYRIVLDVTDSEGNRARSSVTRVAGDAVRASIDVDTERPLRSDEPLQVSADVTRPRDQRIAEYEWTLSPVFNFEAEEATTATGTPTTFQFDQSGEHYLQLRVTDGNGVTTTDRRSLAVVTPVPDDGQSETPDPDVRIAGDPPGETDPFWIGDSVRFDLEYEPAGTTITSVDWSFREVGFGGEVLREASGEAVSVRFSQSAAYQVTVSIDLANGDTVTRTREGGSDFSVYEVRLADATDLDGDGLKEDVNGNGRVDFGDVVTFARAVESPKNPVLISSSTRDAFSFAGNDLITDADVDALDTMVQERIGSDDDA